MVLDLAPASIAAPSAAARSLVPGRRARILHPAARPSGRGGARILVVDDNQAVQDGFARILGGGGGPRPALEGLAGALFGEPVDDTEPPAPYRVDGAAQGEIALEMMRTARDEADPYSVAFVDMRMPPGWNGVETTARLWEIDPVLPVVLCTAYSDFRWDQVLAALPNRTGSLHLLRKPFAAAQVRKMADVLSTKVRLLRRGGRAREV